MVNVIGYRIRLSIKILVLLLSSCVIFVTLLTVSMPQIFLLNEKNDIFYHTEIHKQKKFV